MRWGKFLLGLLLALIGLALALPFLVVVVLTFTPMQGSTSLVAVAPGAFGLLGLATVVGLVALVIGTRIAMSARRAIS